MRKFFISFIFIAAASLASPSQAQYYGGTSYYNDMANYTYFWNYATDAQKAIFGIDQFFGALNYSVGYHRQTKAAEQAINQGRNQLENYKSLKRYVTEGPVPFASHAPDGRPRSEKIRWEDIQSIDGTGFGDNP
ncbi:MAG: hypothetical protein H7A32_02875 [Deltaproteobacteria bacterium]|nr:hypothetical protein [Deltaproteobacteria bacterium]